MYVVLTGLSSIYTLYSSNNCDAWNTPEFSLMIVPLINPSNIGKLSSIYPTSIVKVSGLINDWAQDQIDK